MEGSLPFTRQDRARLEARSLGRFRDRIPERITGDFSELFSSCRGEAAPDFFLKFVRKQAPNGIGTSEGGSLFTQVRFPISPQLAEIQPFQSDDFGFEISVHDRPFLPDMDASWGQESTPESAIPGINFSGSTGTDPPKPPVFGPRQGLGHRVHLIVIPAVRELEDLPFEVWKPGGILGEMDISRLNPGRLPVHGELLIRHAQVMFILSAIGITKWLEE